MNKLTLEEKYKLLKHNFLYMLDLAYRSGFEQGYSYAQQEFYKSQIQQQTKPQEHTQNKLDGISNLLNSDIPNNSFSNKIDHLLELLEDTDNGIDNKQGIFTDDVLKSSNDNNVDFNTPLDKAENTENVYTRKLKQSLNRLRQMFGKNLNHEQKRSLVGQEKMIRDIIDKWKKQKEELEIKIQQDLQSNKINLE